MRIAIVHNLGGGGGKRYLYEHARLLRERGHQLTAFVPASASEAYLPLAPLCDAVTVYGENPATTADSGGDAGQQLSGARQLVKRVLGEAAHDRIRDTVWVQKRERAADALSLLYAQMARDIDAAGFDILYAHQCDTMLAPDILRQVNKTPTLFCCHDSLRRAYEWDVQTPPNYDRLPDSGTRQKRLGRVQSPILWNHLEREERRYAANTRAASGVLVNSWYSREAILRSTGISGRVCYAGVDSDFFCPDPAVPKENLVVSVGALAPNKRHEFVLQAIASLPETLRPRLEIIGYETYYGRPGLGPVAQSLQEAAKRANVRLVIRKDITDETLRDAYRRARVFAFAPYLEPFGLVPLEAAACGTPTVGVCEAGVRETVQHEETGLLTGLDTVEFADALARLLQDDALTRRLGDAARHQAKTRWTWERSADVLEDALCRVVTKENRCESVS